MPVQRAPTIDWRSLSLPSLTFIQMSWDSRARLLMSSVSRSLGPVDALSRETRGRASGLTCLKSHGRRSLRRSANMMCSKLLRATEPRSAMLSQTKVPASGSIRSTPRARRIRPRIYPNVCGSLRCHENETLSRSNRDYTKRGTRPTCACPSCRPNKTLPCACGSRSSGGSRAC